MKKSLLTHVTIFLTVLLLVGMVAVPGFAADDKVKEDKVQIVYMPGGPAGGSFASIKAKGARDAAEILGDRVNLRIFYGNWNPQNDVKIFQESMAMNPDGIAVIGWGAIEPFVEEAIDKGIIVTTQNVALGEVEEKYKAKGFGYVGQEQYSSGYTLGKAAAERSGLGEGDSAMVWGLKSEPVRGQRTRGVIDALEEAGLEVDHMEISSEVDKDAANGIPVFTGYMQSHPEIDMVVTDHGGLTATQEEYFKSAGLDPDEVYGAGFDLSPATARAIKSGFTDLVLDQQPYLQGFLPVFQIYLTARYNFSGLHIDTGSGLVGPSNIDVIAPLAEKGIR
ncbi:MAG: substrate-binding domain-containing protein [Candidatus Bipolaricaulota bacterium]